MEIFSTIEQQDLALRWARIQQLMTQSDVDALLVSDNVNLCYVSGRVFGGVAYIPAEGNPIFFVRRPVGLEGDMVAYMRKFEDIPAMLSERGYAQPTKIALEGDILSFNEYSRLQKAFGLDSSAILSSATTILRRARSVKTPYEIEQTRLSGIKHAELYSKIKSIFRAGMSDYDLGVELEYQSRLLGSLGSMRIFGRSMEIFVGSVLVGANADAPSPYDFALGGAGMDKSLPVGCSGTPIEEGTTIMVDVCGNFNRYMTDMTRVFSLGIIPDQVLQAHQVALEMQNRMEQMVKSGTPTADVYNMCFDLAKSESLSEYFMGCSQQAGFVGHGVGLEINEMPVMAPRSREIYESGVVFAFEPKFVFPEIGAVGIENTFVVNDGGVEKLTIFEESIISLD